MRVSRDGPPSLLHRPRRNLLRRDDDRAFETGRAGQADHPTLQPQPVPHEQPRCHQRAQILRPRLVHMHVPIRPDQSLHADRIAANLPHQISQDREARHHPQWLRRHPSDRRQSQSREETAPKHRTTLQRYNITF